MQRIPGLLVILFELTFNSNVYSNQKDSSLLFLAHTRIFPSVFLDPLDCQTSGGSNFLFRKGNDVSLYSMVNLGFTKPVISKFSESVSWELNLGAASFTQFDLLKKSGGSYLAGLLNNDYKISADFSLQKLNKIFRFRVFHVSSHLGDDYIFRHNDTIRNDKSDNYEQADFTFLRMWKSNYFYLGAGEIYTKYVFRKRSSFQGGGYLNFGKSEKLNFFASTNIRLLAQNDFNPDIRIAFGLNILRKSEPLLRIWIDYFSGHLPYGTLDYGRISWLGANMLINIF
jgi:hypothetical protein